MEYSKEFVTAVVLGKDLVPRQVEKYLNSVMNLCCSVPNHLFPVQNTWIICVSSFLIFLSFYCSLFIFPIHCVTVFFLDTSVGGFMGKSLLCERKGGMSYLWNPSLWYLEYQVCHLPGLLCYLGPVLDVLPPHLGQFVPKSLFHVTSSLN